MNKLLIATGNPAKFQRYKQALNRVPNLQVLSLKDINFKLNVEETGKTGKENALLKAKAYSELGYYVLAVDEELYIRGLEEDKQPGLNIRRCIGKKASDDELLQYFLNIIKSMPSEKIDSEFIFHIILLSPTRAENYAKYILNFQFLKEPMLPLKEGYPLDSLIYFPQFNKRLGDLTDEEQIEKESSLKQTVLDLVRNVLE